MSEALAIYESTDQQSKAESEPEDVFREFFRQLRGLFVTIVDSKIYLPHQTAKEFLPKKQA
ncbi:hypothetical protein MCOR14_010561, partial [Pyricularia oryzae]